jgi:uncharacterized repeat protein (TIGR03803 family)
MIRIFRSKGSNETKNFCSLKFLVVLGLGALAPAQTFTTLYQFTLADGAYPLASVIQDQTGNLYGTTSQGGSRLSCDYLGHGCGVVYKLDDAGVETVLHSFCPQTDCLDGAYPQSPVVRDKTGNIYGTATGGGSTFLGVVFKIDTAGNESVLYNFTGGSDGCQPYQGVIRDKAGNLYGTTSGCNSAATIFKVDHAGKFHLLHSFKGHPSDGAGPVYGHLTMDQYGNLYGVTTYGGSGGCEVSYGEYGCGVLYELGKNGTYRVLYNFKGGTEDGCTPYGSVVQDKSGSFYGTTYGCGSAGLGTVWKVTAKGKEAVLHHFQGPLDGCNPYAGVARDPTGNLYGVTWGCDTLYKLSAKGKLTQLHSFSDRDPGSPIGELLRTSAGALFGTTVGGPGSFCPMTSCGTVWKYVP